MMTRRIGRLTVTAAVTRVSLSRRQIGGTLFRYGEIGLTSAGPLVVDDPEAIQIPSNLAEVTLTRDHDRDAVRGHLAVVDDNGERLYVVAQVLDGADGDEALADADPAARVRGALSYDLEDVETVDSGQTYQGEPVPAIVSARLVAIGQVPEGAYNSARIDQVAASRTAGASRTNTTGGSMTPEQIARLAELRSLESLTPEQEAELTQLEQLAVEEFSAAAEAEETPEAAPATQHAAASLPAVGRGVPRPTSSTIVRERAGSPLRRMVKDVTAALVTGRSGGNSIAAITAALSDVVSTGITDDIEQVAWSGELWSGLEYEPLFSDLLIPDTLTNWEGKGWRFVTAPSMADYAGDKAAIPSGTVTTESSEYEAARMAVGVDIDRKFYDFPNEGFVQGLFERIRESWEIALDTKARSYITSTAVQATRPLTVTTVNTDATVTAATGSFTAADVGATITGTGIPASTTVLSVTNSSTIEMSANATASGTVTAQIGAAAGTALKAAARLSQALKRLRVGKLDWVVMSDEDLFTLLDVTNDDVPAFLNLYGINADDFRSSPDVATGTIYGGNRKAAKLRTLPGSPIRVSAQDLAKGGVDEAFFGYWAIEEHHPNGIVKATFKRPA